MGKGTSTQRLMNASGGSFKAPQASSSDIRAGAQEDLDRLSMNSSRAKMKATAPRNLKPIPGKTTVAASASKGALSMHQKKALPKKDAEQS